MPKPLKFQELVQNLNDYWAEQGCLIVQPYDLEVGAGTFSPHTFEVSSGSLARIQL